MSESQRQPSGCRVIAICNQKGGVTKTTTTANFGVGLAMQGKKVLLVDADPQADLTTALGWPDSDNLPVTLYTVMDKIIRDADFEHFGGILHHDEGVDLMPSSIELADMEMTLVTAMSREYVLREYLGRIKHEYDYVLIDCPPSLSMLTINALAAADSVIVPVQAQYLPAKGMTDQVSTVIVKDMSRLGRNYLEVGQLTEIFFPQHDVRFIAVNDSVDSSQGEDDFTPFRNIMNEWYAKDMSRKLRSAQRTKSKLGYAIGLPPLGYKHDTVDPRRWVIDEESADVIRRIYQMRKNGTSTYEIVKILKREKVLTPSAYAIQKGYSTPPKRSTRGEYFWDKSTVLEILTNQSYVGDVINFKTYSKSYKLKERLNNPKENWEIHKDVHEPIIERSLWEDIQKTFGDTKYRKPKHIEKNMFAGYLKCSDCGANLNYKYTHDNPDNHYFSCHNKRQNNGLCTKTHHIRVDILTRLVREHISGITRFANQFEDDFVKVVVDEHYKRICQQQKRNQDALNQMLARDKELDTLYEKLYEEKILGNLSEERFQKLSYKYEDEQAELKQRIKHMKKVVAEDKTHEMNCDGFLEMVRKYTNIAELTPEILSEFIDKIVVHHREEVFEETVQKVEIYYKMIGFVELPSMSKSEKETYIKCFSRKKENRSA